jgi:hypothetical protein
MKLKWDKWFYALGQTTIGGAAATMSAWLGTLIGNQISKDIPVLDWKAMGFVLVFSIISNLFFFLKDSPLPKQDDK